MSEDPQNTPTSTPGGTKGSPQRLGVTATAVAVLAVVLWVVFTLILFFYIDHDELQWTRLTWLFSSVQAIAFAGAGALFGTVVQKDRADKAEQRAATAEADADAQRESAVKGRALGTVLQARAAEGIGAEADRRAPMGNAGQQPTPAPDVRGEYAQLSKALFGDLMG
jgi:hypothetical protein